MDWSIAHSLNAFLAGHDAVEDPLLLYVKEAEALFLGMLVVVLVCARHVRWMSVRRAAVSAGLSAGLGLLVAKAITEFVHRPRPFVAHPAAIHLFDPHVADASFPSDHATASFAIAVAILLRGKSWWGWITMVLALILVFGRVALGLHYPTDVLGGAAIGVLAALVVWTPKVRGLVDALSDRAGGAWDRLVDAVIGRLAGARPAR